jgi:prepilin-type N-terminal cleavage/methylation domain-containing protein
MKKFFQSGLVRPQKGFSLAELMVSVALFSIVITIGVGTLMVMIDANAKAQALYSVMTNLSFSTDSMTRNIRTAYNYYCTTDNINQLPGDTEPGQGGTQECVSGGDAFVFNREIDGQRMGYRLNTINGRGAIEENSGNGWLRITPEEVNITMLQFRALGTDAGDTNQARVMIRIEGMVDGYSGQGASFALQTQVAQQILNY